METSPHEKRNDAGTSDHAGTSDDTSNGQADAPQARSENHQEVLESVMAEYLEQIDSGKMPDPANYLEAYPQHADELSAFFRNHHWLGITSTLKPVSRSADS